MTTDDDFARVITSGTVRVEVMRDRSGVEIHEARTVARHSVVLTRAEATTVHEALGEYLRNQGAR